MYSTVWPILLGLNAAEGTEQENECADRRKRDPPGPFRPEADPELGLITADGCTCSHGWQNNQSTN